MRYGIVLAVLLCNLLPAPAQAPPGVLHLPFDGDLRDTTGHGHEPTVAEPRFEPGQVGQALRVGPRPPGLADRHELRAAAGLKLDCWVKLPPVPPHGQAILLKSNEYMLRQDPPNEGGKISFFLYLNGWEPRVQSAARAEPETWYHLTAGWDGTSITLEVNGARTRIARSGRVEATANPLQIGSNGQVIDEVKVDNPRLPVIRLRDMAQQGGLLRAGRPEPLTFTFQNVGADAAPTTAALALPAGLVCQPGAAQEIGPLPTGEERTVSWTVQAAAATTALATIRLATAGQVSEHRLALPFLPATDPSPAALLEAASAGQPAATWYIDSVAGDNANAGTSPTTAWRDFSNINGKILGPGERLLLKRGSVFNQELVLSAKGTADRWAQIAAYGEGPRPTIRRNWDIADRCALIKNPDYLRISGLVVCYAAKGLMVVYEQEGHVGLVIDDCLAHHIEGLYRPNSHGIPEWRDRPGPGGDGMDSSAGIGIGGARARQLLLRDCEMYQCSWGFRATGEDVMVDRVYCHDNYTHNTSPHPALINVRRSYLQNSVLDAPGWHAFAGTMGIMLVNIEGLLIRNCTWRNQPDSGSHDEGGIDFEAGGNGCLIECCTFERNAGAAIELLGLTAAQPKNVEIAHSRFIQNNLARKLGPSEIYIWGKSRNPEVSCSTGKIHDNGYTLNEGVEFFVNEAPQSTRWTLADNAGYASPEALRRAMPLNEPPAVDCGEAITASQPTVTLAAKVSDDGLPQGRALTLRWEVLEAPGPVRLSQPTAATTQAELPTPGDYLLRLVADDGELWLSDLLPIHRLPAGAEVRQAWEFDRPLDKQGWSEAELGTKVIEYMNQRWPCRSEPVKHVGGGYFVLAVEDTTTAHLLSPTDLGIDLGESQVVRLRLQNHTPATRLRLRWTTTSSQAWAESQAKEFEVVPNDSAPRVYTVDLRGAAGWQGRLQQLRLDLATGPPLTGTFRLDYVLLGNAALAN